MATLKINGFDGTGLKTPSGGDELEIDCNVLPNSTAVHDIGSDAKRFMMCYVSGLRASGNANSDYVAIVDNDQGTNAHGLKVTTDGTGAGSFILDAETGSNTIFRVRADGKIGMGNPLPSPLSHTLTINGSLRASGLIDSDNNTIRLRATRTVTNSNDAGDQGEICYDANYLYVCVATNTWKRIPLDTW